MSQYLCKMKAVHVYQNSDSVKKAVLIYVFPKSSPWEFLVLFSHFMDGFSPLKLISYFNHQLEYENAHHDETINITIVPASLNNFKQ